MKLKTDKLEKIQGYQRPDHIVIDVTMAATAFFVREGDPWADRERTYDTLWDLLADCGYSGVRLNKHPSEYSGEEWDITVEQAIDLIDDGEDPESFYLEQGKESFEGIVGEDGDALFERRLAHEERTTRQRQRLNELKRTKREM